jgi:hypothetical protein
LREDDMKKLSILNKVCKRCGSLTALDSFCDCEDKLYRGNIDNEVIGFLANQLAKLDFAVVPTLKFGAMKNIDYRDDNSIGSAEIRVTAIFPSPSGFLVRGEVPVFIRKGNFVSPSTIYFGEEVAVLSSNVVNDKIKAGTYSVPFQERKNMLSPPLDPQQRMMYSEMPEEDKKVVENRVNMFDPPK